ncbi:hypothetical protein [Gemmatimonas sp.]
MRLSSASPPLLALANATAEWQAGLPSLCSATVRLLDHVHFVVYRGDCAVVHHSDPASARVLLAALSGSPLAVTYRWRGERYCAPGVRIRRCSISVHAVAALQAGWQAAVPARGDADLDLGPPEHPVVHLMRASRQGSLSASERRQWSNWATRARRRGGALVLVVPAPPPALAMVRADTPRLPPDAAEWPARHTLNENAAPEYSGAADSTASWLSGPAPRHRTPLAKREVWLHHGRLISPHDGG